MPRRETFSAGLTTFNESSKFPLMANQIVVFDSSALFIKNVGEMGHFNAGVSDYC